MLTTLNTSYPLHGAKDHAQLTAIINGLMEHEGRVVIVSANLGVSMLTVGAVAVWYQSLWMRP